MINTPCWYCFHPFSDIINCNQHVRVPFDGGKGPVN
jgi:hypothetical protein